MCLYSDSLICRICSRDSKMKNYAFLHYLQTHKENIIGTTRNWFYPCFHCSQCPPSEQSVNGRITFGCLRLLFLCLLLFDFFSWQHIVKAPRHSFRIHEQCQQSVRQPAMENTPLSKPQVSSWKSACQRKDVVCIDKLKQLVEPKEERLLSSAS